MAKATTHPLSLPWALLRRPIGPAARSALSRVLRRWLAWQRRLEAWPRLPVAPDATPFVSLYARGRLLGCVGSHDGAPGRRVARAFLRALHDPRAHALPADREAMSAEVGYLTEAHALPADPAAALAQVEVGTHGLAWVPPDVARAALLLPQVARDHGWNAAQLLDALCDKAHVRRDELASGTLFRLAAETVSSHAEVRGTPATLAARWLADRIARDGTFDFAIDPRSRQRIADGLMRHGRIAVALEALAGRPQHAARRLRAARRLAEEIEAGLRGEAPPGWPDDDAVIGGTLALAVRAGLPFADALAARANSPALLASPWHAAQVVAALGPRAPDSLWASCVDDLSRRAFAPWTALAAIARDDRATYARAAAPLCDAIAARGGVALGEVPEVALTAITVEALLAGPASPRARAAIARGRDFLTRWQLAPGRVPAALDPELAHGAFPASPVASILRIDVTAHALLALSRR